MRFKLTRKPFLGTMRTKRTFAWFPIYINSLSIDKNHYVWLEYIYKIQKYREIMVDIGHYKKIWGTEKILTKEQYSQQYGGEKSIDITNDGGNN